jgi:hypothetical protein
VSNTESTAETTQHSKLWSTPFRDLLRGRITGRLDWKSPLRALPAPLAKAVEHVTRRTRLSRLEKAGVAGELAAHFLDGLESGATPQELIERFGDPKAVAKLIRRAKIRNRPLPWHVWNVCFRAAFILLLIYGAMLIRFCIGKPTPSVDYIARLNAPILAAPAADRAWPIWRQALLATGRDFSTTMDSKSDPEELPWAQAVPWLEQHSMAIELARQAAKKPLLGFVLGPDGSENDPQLHFVNSKSAGNAAPMITVLLPHLNHLRWMALLLSMDARRATELHDGARLEADLDAIRETARQLRESDGFLITQLVALGLDRLVVDRLGRSLSQHPEVLSDQQLIRLAHQLAGPEVAGDLLNLRSERYFFDDLVQRMYTDDGHGSGRLTLAGLRMLPMLTPINSGSTSTDLNDLAIGTITPIVSASRADLLARYNQVTDQADENFRKPIWRVDLHSMDARLIAMRQSVLEDARYALITIITPSLTGCQETAERYLGCRDGVLAGIALEIYHRRHGDYPVSLAELTPLLLPSIPADRITGDPVRYRLIDGKPVVYSVGNDRIDNGGKAPTTQAMRLRGTDSWETPDSSTPAGDWILYPPVVNEYNK